MQPSSTRIAHPNIKALIKHLQLQKESQKLAATTQQGAASSGKVRLTELNLALSQEALAKQDHEKQKRTARSVSSKGSTPTSYQSAILKAKEKVEKKGFQWLSL